MRRKDLEPQTIAQRELKRRNKTGEISQTALALAIGVKQPSVSAWCTRAARPEGALLRLLIQRETGIKADDWLTDGEYRSAYGHARNEHAA